MPRRERIVPAVLSCDRDSRTFRHFAASYRRCAGGLPAPVVVLDASACAPSPPYRYLVERFLHPRSIDVHERQAHLDQYESIQHGAHVLLERALAAAGPDDFVLFIEDDITFSSRFAAALLALEVPDDAGLVTFYLPDHGYGGAVVDPEQFYGTQCVLFPRRAVADLVAAHEDMRQRFRPGWDLRWSRFLAERGYRLYASEHSYVQHLGHISRMSEARGHRSRRFVL